MEGIFQTPVPNYESNSFRDLSFKNNYAGFGPQNYLFPVTQPFNKVEPISERDQNANQKTAKFYLSASDSKANSSQNNQSTSDVKRPFHFNFLAGLNKNVYSPKCTDDDDANAGSMQIADEHHEGVNLAVYNSGEKWRPSTRPQKDLPATARSKTPTDLITKESLTSRMPPGRCKTPNTTGKRPKLEDQDQDRSKNESPSRRQNYYGSTERYYESMTEKLLHQNYENYQSALSKKSCESPGVSPQKRNKSTLLNSSTRSICYTPIKKSARMTSLKEIKLAGTPNVEAKTKAGFGVVKETLDEVLQERDQLKALVNQLNQAIKEEKAAYEKTQERIRLLANHGNCLSKRNESLDKNTVNLQAVVHKTREEVQQLQREIVCYTQILQHISHEVETEKDLIKFNEQNNKELKICLLEETKERDLLKNQVETSRQEKKKAIERFNNAGNTQRNIIITLENQFQRYAS